MPVAGVKPYERISMTILHLTATTTGASQGVSITRVTPEGSSITIYWGDSDSTVVSIGDSTEKTHIYATADTYNITIDNADNIVALYLGNSRISGFDSSELSNAAITYFIISSLGSTPASTINTADMVNWRPTTWTVASLPTSGTYTVNSAHMVDWRPTNWRMYNMPAGTYTINTADMVDWRPNDFWDIFGMPAGTYTINTSNMVDWRPGYWAVYNMPAGTYTINTADMVNWRPNTFAIRSMPAGTYTINLAHTEDWNPEYFQVYWISSGLTFTFSENNLSNFSNLYSLYLHDNGFTQNQVDAILYSVYVASITPRTKTGGSIGVGGTNITPSGTFQAATSCPVTSTTPGKEVAHELKNDGCSVGFNKWTTITYSSIEPPTQSADPTSDISIGQWTDQDLGTTDLYISLADDDDATYVISEEAPDGDILEVLLAAAEFPETYQDHFVEYRFKKNYVSGPQINLEVTLMCGSTEIASWTETDITGTDWVDQSRELTSPQAASITDYTNLRLRFQSYQVT
jgi:hypothetical protein